MEGGRSEVLTADLMKMYAMLHLYGRSFAGRKFVHGVN